MVPWGAMGLEMTPDYHERTRIQAVGNFFGNAGAILMPWLFALTQLDIFEDGLQGARYVGLLMGIVLTVSGLIPVFLCKEGQAETASHQEKIGFWTGLKTTLGNRTFLLLMAVVFLVSTGFFIIFYPQIQRKTHKKACSSAAAKQGAFSIEDNRVAFLGCACGTTTYGEALKGME